MTAKNESQKWVDYAFNMGCDSRLAGRPRSDNPFHENHPYRRDERRAWFRGWEDVDHFWGTSCRQAKRLANVRDA